MDFWEIIFSLFPTWCKHFVEDIQGIRSDPDLWALLILDSHHTHTMVPEVLNILNETNILAISLPSHSSSLLQVHDLSIFRPLKKYLSSNISQYVERERS